MALIAGHTDIICDTRVLSLAYTLHLVVAAGGFHIVCDVVCLQHNRIHAIVDLQCWGYHIMFLSSKYTMNTVNNYSFFSPGSIRFGQLINM